MKEKIHESLENCSEERVLIKKCHVCGHLNEGTREMEQCAHCDKSFLPLNYFSKLYDGSSEGFQQLFCQCNELTEEDMIKGLYVLW